MTSVTTYSVETYKNNKHIHTVHGVRFHRIDSILECWECREGDTCPLRASAGVCKETAAWENLSESSTHDFYDRLGTLWCISVENVRNYGQG